MKIRCSRNICTSISVHPQTCEHQIMLMRGRNIDQNVSSSHHVVFSCEKTIWCDDERMLVDMQSVMIGDGVGGHTWAGC
jgi:hypothetical protein